jgi:hypothetical protein
MLKSYISPISQPGSHGTKAVSVSPYSRQALHHSGGIPSCRTAELTFETTRIFFGTRTDFASHKTSWVHDEHIPSLAKAVKSAKDERSRQVSSESHVAREWSKKTTNRIFRYLSAMRLHLHVSTAPAGALAAVCPAMGHPVAPPATPFRTVTAEWTRQDQKTAPS